MTLENFLKKTGEKIASLRKAQALRQKEAAHHAGISYRYYQSIERGKANITISTLFRLSKFYSVNPCDIIPVKFDF